MVCRDNHFCCEVLTKEAKNKLSLGQHWGCLGTFIIFFTASQLLLAPIDLGYFDFIHLAPTA